VALGEVPCVRPWRYASLTAGVHESRRRNMLLDVTATRVEHDEEHGAQIAALAG
jgi:hypothetical protein